MTIIEAEKIILRFGRWEGFSLGEVARREVSYLDFLAGISHTLDAWLQEGVALVCEKHGRGAKVAGVKNDTRQGELFNHGLHG